MHACQSLEILGRRRLFHKFNPERSDLSQDLEGFWRRPCAVCIDAEVKIWFHRVQCVTHGFDSGEIFLA